MTVLDKFLFWYTLVFAVILTSSTVSRGFSPSNLILIALFLPLTTFVILQSIKRYYLWKTKQILNEDSSPGTRRQPQSTFSIGAFLSQKQPLFVISLILYCVALLTSIIRFVSIGR